MHSPKLPLMALVPIQPDLMENDHHSTCTNCQNIAFDEIFRMQDIRKRQSKGMGIFVHDLSYPAVPTCALCQIFTKLKSLNSNHTTKQNWRLVARSAAQRFSDHLPDTTILTVDPLPSIATWRTTSFLLSTSGLDCLSGRRISNMVDWNIVKTWLEICKNHHTRHCRRNDFSQVPGFRAIDCEARKIVAVGNAHLEYVTLSYVWGQGSDERISGHELPNELPRTIDDAIKVVLSLGYRYLWVDRYCIPQASSTENAKLIDCMGLIYENSAFTIIAAAGDNPTYGLPGAGKTPRTPQPHVQVGSQSITPFSFTTIEEITTSKWNTRGWTYQEALLSRRKLVFLEQCVIFQCGAMHCFENLSVPKLSLHTKDLQQFRADFAVPMPFPSRGVGHEPRHITYRISEYSRRDFTHNDDILRAFQGVLQKFMRMKYPVAQFYGIPLFAPNYFKPERQSITERFIYGFSWIIRGPAVCRHGLPSWNWIGWKLAKNSSFDIWHADGASSTRRKLDIGAHPVTTVLSVEFIDRKVVPWEQAHQDTLQNAGYDYPPIYLHLVGFMFDIELSKDGDSYVNHTWPSKGWNSFPRPQEVQFPFDKKNNFRVPCLVVSHTHTLVFVLLLVELKERRYERVGSSYLYCWSSTLRGLSTFSEMEMIEGIDLRKQHFRIG